MKHGRCIGFEVIRMKRPSIKFYSCKWSKGDLCYRPHTSRLGKVYDKLFGTPTHAVGANGYSMEAHCRNCERYEKG